MARIGVTLRAIPVLLHQLAVEHQPVLLTQRPEHINDALFLLPSAPGWLLHRAGPDALHHWLQQRGKHAIAVVRLRDDVVDLPPLGDVRQVNQHLLLVAAGGAAALEHKEVAVQLRHHSPRQLVTAAAGRVNGQNTPPGLFLGQPALNHGR